MKGLDNDDDDMADMRNLFREMGAALSRDTCLLQLLCSLLSALLATDYGVFIGKEKFKKRLGPEYALFFSRELEHGRSKF